MTIDNAREERQPLDGKVDFSMMYAAHDAFTRHLERFASAIEHGRAATPQTRAGWVMFKGQLHLHHTTEDKTLWPKLRAAVSRPDEVAVLDAMELEHAQLDPLLERIDVAMTAVDTVILAASVQALIDSLGAHMRHEENEALPLVETHLGPDGWAAFGQDIRKSQGIRGAAVYLPWLFDGAPEGTRTEVLGLLPRPARFLYRRFWEPRYRRAVGS
jgi:iron-sulfur cluster repair protein YtfE (RIC family)